MRELAVSIEQGKVGAVVTNGNLIDEEIVGKAAFSLVIDCLESLPTQAAQVVLPTAVLSESSGTFRCDNGEIQVLRQASLAPGEARPEWRILCSLAQHIGRDTFDYDTVEAVTRLIQDDAAPAPLGKDPRDNSRDIATHFRGHLVADIIPSLAAFGVPITTPESSEEAVKEGFALIEKREIVPNMHYLTIEAPQVAGFAKPGQFAILMAGETGLAFFF